MLKGTSCDTEKSSKNIFIIIIRGKMINIESRIANLDLHAQSVLRSLIMVPIFPLILKVGKWAVRCFFIWANTHGTLCRAHADIRVG